ncbi:MAG TPA: STAS domain-containing protein [Streptosporangiaceae bacterium]|jgi:anti-sigma B factor antagonist|nr:STAS domain-containing protein [Streptosporangiaceae bacterium]
MLDVDLSIRDGDGLAVVALRGELDLADAPGVATHLITAVAVGGPSVIVDLADLEGIGYSGLMVLLRVWKWTRRTGGELLLAAPQQSVHRILKATGLIDVFSVYRSVEEAASRARQEQAAAAPRRLPVSRCGGRPRVFHPPHHSPGRSLHRHRTCRSRHMARYGCVKWR